MKPFYLDESHSNVYAYEQYLSRLVNIDAKDRVHGCSSELEG
jgi:hypothetical protein